MEVQRILRFGNELEVPVDSPSADSGSEEAISSGVVEVRGLVVALDRKSVV